MKNSLLNKGLRVLGTWGLGWKASTLLLALVLPVLRAAAQTAPADSPEMADAFRADGKIYVVVAVITVVLAGLLVLLVSLDKKVSRLERELKD